MLSDSDWDLIRNERGWRLGDAGLSSLSIAAIFGVCAVALTVFLVPMLDDGRPEMSGYRNSVDPLSTGALANASGSSYVIRRSVLQSSPDAICIIRDNGTRVGDC